MFLELLRLPQGALLFSRPGSSALVGGLLLASVTPAFAQTTTELTSADCPVCDMAASDGFLEANEQQGVRSFDPDGDLIPGWASTKFAFVLGKNWYPLSYYKETICGQQHHAGWHRLRLPWPLSLVFTHEDDWNVFTIPRPEFEQMFLDALALMSDPSKTKDCSATDDCFEAELNPDEPFFNNPYYPVPAGGPKGGYQDLDSPLDRLDVCFYGPWVSEEAHHDRPELHPFDSMWWSEGQSRILAVYLDDSKRFDEKGHFGRMSGVPTSPDWRPWSASPKTNTFRIYFEVPSDVFPPLEYGVKRLYDSHVVTGNYLPSQDGPVHVLTYDGSPILRIEELNPDEQLRIDFDGICRTNDTIKGYVAITTVVERPDSNSGYHVIEFGPLSQVTRGGPSASALAAVEASPQQGPEVQMSLQPATLGPGSDGAMRGSVRVSLTYNEPVMVGEVDRSLTLMSSTAVGVTPRPLQRSSDREFSIVLENVPAFEGGTFELQSPLDEIVAVSIPPSRLALRIASRRPEVEPIEGVAWRNLAAAAGAARPDAAEPPGQVARVVRWEVEVEPYYGSTEEGDLSGEGQTVFSAYLNSIIQSERSSEIERVFGRSEPLTVAWEVDASDVTADRMFEVDIGAEAVPSVVALEFPDRFVERSSVTARLPTTSPDHAVRVTGTATVRDPFDHAATVRATVWSLLVRNSDEGVMAERTVAVLAPLTGLDVDFASRSLPTGSRDPLASRDRLTRLAESLRLRSARYAADLYLEIDELSTLLRGARRAAGGDN